MVGTHSMGQTSITIAGLISMTARLLPIPITHTYKFTFAYKVVRELDLN